MCKAIEDMCKEAMERGRTIARIESVRNLKKNLGLSEPQVKEILEISDDDWELIAGQI